MTDEPRKAQVDRGCDEGGWEEDEGCLEDVEGYGGGAVGREGAEEVAEYLFCREGSRVLGDCEGEVQKQPMTKAVEK